MRIPVICDYTRSYFKDRLCHKELQVGDVVYYMSHTSPYAIKKSTIVAKKELPYNHHFRLLEGCELMLADGTGLEYYDLFDSKEQAIAYIVADLKSSLAHKHIALQTLQQEIATEERLLTFFEGKQKKLP